ncbi:MAG: HAMP domain-containing histidine kinase [Lachnospiraceae bacterium]|nr:HAMP domain-containing histidine kinase [Lachnospiraceae bacterium]
MFHKAHLFFAILYGGTTAAIMIIMSLSYLRISEKNLHNNQFASFENDVGTVVISLEQSTYISMQWLAGIESRNGYSIFVIDNGVPFLYNTLRNPVDSYSQMLLTESLDAYNIMFKTEKVETEGSSYSGVWHTEYEFISPTTGNSYFCALIDIERNTSLSQIIILHSLEDLRTSIRNQRILFLWMNLGTVTALFIFAYLFTGKLLKPLQENQERHMQFIAAASHELRTPLSVILASSECCRSADAAEQAGFFNTIRKEGRRMNNLIDEMLMLAHSGIKHFPIEKKSVELDTLCINTYEAFEPLCRQKGITLSLTLPDMPLIRCACDSDRIAQVLSVLLHNAVSYTPEGGCIELALAYHRERRSSFEITVTDTGVGISDDDKRHIFERFYRAEKSRSTKGHFGLGLSIAYEIVTAHHGKISVQDNPGGGSVFSVRLP